MTQPLHSLQRRMLSSIAGQGEDISVADMLRPTAHLDAQAALAIYQFGYMARLMACMRSDYPLLGKYLGAELFDMFSRAYLEAHPSQAYSLFELGAGFADFLDQSRPKDESLAQAQAACLAFAVELARLERQRVCAIRAEGPESAAFIDADYNDTELLRLCRYYVPGSTRLIETQYLSDERYQQLQTMSASDIAALPITPQSALLALARSNYRVSVHALEAWQYRLLDAVAKQCRATGEAAAFDTMVGPAGGRAFLLARLPFWLPAAVSCGLLRVELP